jgi:hypothetical protein
MTEYSIDKQGALLFDRTPSTKWSVLQSIYKGSFHHPCIHILPDHGQYQGDSQALLHKRVLNISSVEVREGKVITFTELAYYHDVAHCIDFVLCDEKERLSQRDFGLKYEPNLIDFSDMQSIEAACYSDRKTYKATERELRVSGYEAVMAVHDRKLQPSAVLDHVSQVAWNLTQMKDFANVPGDTIMERRQWCIDKMMRVYHQTNVNELLNGFAQLINFISPLYERENAL